MSLILVVETEQRMIERIRDALGADGWAIQVVDSQAEALRHAAAQPPQVVLVSSEVPGAGDLLRRFCRAHGGPGAVAMVPESPGELPHPATLGADELLAKPFTDQQLRLLASRLRATQPVPAASPGAAPDRRQLTSRDIFGDVLAEVEADERPSALPRPPAASPPPPVASPPSPSTPAPASSRPLASRPSAATTNEVEELLSKTLSGLDVTGRPRRAARPAPAVPVAPPVVEPPPPAPVAPEMPAVAEALPELAPAVVEPPHEPSSPAPSATPSVPAVVVEPAPEAEPIFAPEAPPPLPELPPEVVAPAEPAPVTSPEPRPTAAERPLRRATGEIDLAALDELARPKTKTPSIPSQTSRPDAFSTQRIELSKVARSAAGEFGPYVLLEKIAVGGMAEVWKARKRGPEGFQKTVAIKRILPHLTDSADFISMFIDEAKLAAQLDHNNIIHIHDLGKIDDDYFIAMEFVEGKDLRSALKAVAAKQQTMPIGLALLVASRLASALDYAHRKRDFEGHELGLVHRDVSPQNVLISFEGDIKLCDFGIVKAVSKASKTQLGALKGKLQYMSPEQAWGRTVDGRSDIFSLGSLLFEMLTSRRLFPGDSEISVLEAVREGRFQTPREIAPELPREIEAVVLRALAKEPGDRFHTAGAMQRELERLLLAERPIPSQNDLAAWMRRIFDLEPMPEPTPSRVPESKPATVAPPPPAAATPHADVLVADEAALAPIPSVAPAPAAEPTADGAFTTRSPSPLLWLGIAAGVIAVAGLAWVLSRRPAEAPGAAPAAESVAAQPMATSTLEPALSSPGEPVAAPTAARATVAPPVPTAAPTVAPTVATSAPSAPVTATEVQPAAAPTAEPPPARETPAEPAATAAPTPAPIEETRSPVGGEVPPALVAIEKPQYPPVARRLKVQGEVVVSMLVDENGNVVESRLTKPFPQNVGFNEAALAAARSARFRPATRGGVPVKAWYQLRVPFKL